MSRTLQKNNTSSEDEHTHLPNEVGYAREIILSDARIFLRSDPKLWRKFPPNSRHYTTKAETQSKFPFLKVNAICVYTTVRVQANPQRSTSKELQRASFGPIDQSKTSLLNWVGELQRSDDSTQSNTAELQKLLQRCDVILRQKDISKMGDIYRALLSRLYSGRVICRFFDGNGLHNLNCYRDAVFSFRLVLLYQILQGGERWAR